jgi:glycosyltransferase involved in cell wall biosynthesis
MTKKRKPKICWITPGHLCNSPRLVKEVSALYNLGYETSVVATQYLPFLSSEDEHFKAQYPHCKIEALNWTAQSIESKIRRYSSAAISKTAICISFFKSRHLNKIILNRHYYWQLKVALAQHADLYIAHNAGAIAVAADAALASKAKFAFDAEDFHSGESIEASLQRGINSLESYYLPKADYITFSSPMIAQAYQERYRLNQPSEIIYNTFNSYQDLHKEKITGECLKMVWFSQTVGLDRGLSQIISGIDKVTSKKIIFDIIGLYDVQDLNLLQSLLPNQLHQLNFTGLLSFENLQLKLPHYDIGVAAEPGKDTNNNFALSNKLFSYLSAGLALLVSDTPAQKNFMNTLIPEAGLLYHTDDEKSVSDALNNWIEKPELLTLHQKHSLELGKQQYNWEKEQQKLITIVQECL